MHKWITEKFTLPFREQLLKFPYFLAFLPPSKNNFPNYLISWKLENHTIYRWPKDFHIIKKASDKSFFASRHYQFDEALYTVARFASTSWTMLRMSTLKLLPGAVCGLDSSFFETSYLYLGLRLKRAEK